MCLRKDPIYIELTTEFDAEYFKWNEYIVELRNIPEPSYHIVNLKLLYGRYRHKYPTKYITYWWNLRDITVIEVTTLKIYKKLKLVKNLRNHINVFRTIN